MKESPSAPTWLAKRPRRLLAILGIVVAVGVPTTVVIFRNPLFHGNFGVVDVERVYRSAQPMDGLDGLVERQRIASILNLRGGSPDDPFYSHEVAVARARRVSFYDLPMSATRRPSRRELLLLLDLFDRCRYPLLIHCKSGSDRTGLASALYLMARTRTPPREALRSFSLAYGHVPLLGTRRLHEPLLEYDAWLSTNQIAHSPERFRHWVESDYRAEDPVRAFLPLPEGPRAWHHPHRAAR